MTTPAEPFTFDLTGLCEKVAMRMSRRGAAHPVAAAAALAARGLSGLDPDDFARQVGLPRDTILASEAGAVPFGELPAVLGDILEAHPDIDLLALADLDSHSGWVQGVWSEQPESIEESKGH